MSAPKSNIKGALFALAGFALFSTHDVVVKTLGATLSTFQIIFYSVLLSFPLVMLMLMRDRTADTLIPKHPWWTALRTGCAVITGLCVFYAFATLPMAEVYAIIFAQPLLITVLAIPILGEQVRLRRWIAVLVGLAGVIVVLRPGATELTLGHAAALLGNGEVIVAGGTTESRQRQVHKDYFKKAQWIDVKFNSWTGAKFGGPVCRALAGYGPIKGFVFSQHRVSSAVKDAVDDCANSASAAWARDGARSRKEAKAAYKQGSIKGTIGKKGSILS